MNIAHFLPKDSLKYISAGLNIDGQGFDWYDKRTFVEASLILNKLQYAGYDLSGIDFLAKLQKGDLNVSLMSKNELLDMNTVLKASLARKDVNANMLINIAKANLYEMRVVGVPLNVGGCFSLNLFSDYKKNHMFEGALKDVYIKTEKLIYNPKDIHFDADLKSDTTSLAVSAGDLNVQVNGKIIKEMGYKVSANDIIIVNGIKLEKSDNVYILLNKPRGVITSVCDDKNRKTVVDLIETDKRVYPV